MAIHDLRSASVNMMLSTDVAIIGAGAAGLTIARELENTPMRVLIIDSGGFEYEAETQTLNAVENVGEPLPCGDVVPVGARLYGQFEMAKRYTGF
jgi:choline dehydrogenase-like flavoprotein